MTIEEARALIRGVEWRGSRPGLSRVRELLHRIGVLIRGGVGRVSVLQGAEQPRGILRHHTGHLPGQKFLRVFLAAGGGGAVGHGHTGLRSAARFRVRRIAGHFRRGQLGAGCRGVSGRLGRVRLFAQRRAAPAAACFRRGRRPGPVRKDMMDERREGIHKSGHLLPLGCPAAGRFTPPAPRWSRRCGSCAPPPAGRCGPSGPPHGR